MPDKNNYHDHNRVENKYLIEVTESEAFVIKSLREFSSFGEFTVYKQDGRITRIESKVSEMITDVKNNEAVIALEGKLVL